MSNPDTTRIFNYPEVTTPASDAKILLDSQTVGSKCIDANLFRCDLIDKTITQRGTFEASEDDADGFKKVVVDIPYTDVHVASGPIATFEGEDLPLKSLTASIVPVQDLHGYDSPWAGGAGKNKFPDNVDNTGSGYNCESVFTGNTLTLTGTSTGNGGRLSLKTKNFSLKAGTYRLKSFYKNTHNKATPTVFLQIGTENVLAADEGTHTLEADTTVATLGANLSNGQQYDFEATYALYTTDENTYYPYSNICPISGWTEEVVRVNGNNWFDMPDDVNEIRAGVTYTTDDDCLILNGTKNGGTYSSFSMISVTLKPGTYYIRAFNISGSASAINLSFYLTEENTNIVAFDFAQAYSFTLTETKTLNLKSAVWADGIVYTDYKVGIVISNTPNIEQFEPYAGTTTTIPFTDSQGQSVTVYGGSVDVVNGGEQPRTLGSVDLGDLNWTYQALSGDRNGFSASISDLKEATSGSDLLPAISSCYKAVGYNDSWVHGVMSYFYPTGKTIIVINNDYTDATAFKTAMAGQELVYELATPITFYTQPTSIKSLDGDNNVFASTGDVDVEYQTVWVRPTE